MLIAAPSLVITGPIGINADSPMLCWHDIVNIDNIAADSAQDAFPVEHLANPATDLVWKSNSLLTQYVTVTTGTIEQLDYMGIARHNFGSTGAQISVEHNIGAGFVQIVPPTIVDNDEPIIFRLPATTKIAVRLKIVPNGVRPYAGVMFVGKATLLQRRLYVGHTPITYGRTFNVVNGTSENGNFLGRVVMSEGRQSNIELQNLTPDWYRAYLDPFIASHGDRTFFFAWRPSSYPRECGYAWVTGNPQPRNQRPNGMMEISIPIAGIAK